MPPYLQGEKEAAMSIKTAKSETFMKAVNFFHAVSTNSAEIKPMPPEYLEQAEAEMDWIFQNSGANVIFGGTQPCFLPDQDTVYMPPRQVFIDPLRFYEVLGHELGHWTGGANRLRRNMCNRFGTPAYRYEEFIAQSCSLILMEEADLPTSFTMPYSYFVGYSDSSNEAEQMFEKAYGEGERAAHFILERASRGR